MFDRDLNGDISCEEMELSIGKSPVSSSDKLLTAAKLRLAANGKLLLQV